ncbi:hypothetical protein V6N12_066493 [Hibiscus sabdariffa]|uniref:RNase H type-1 domain-containing protein n=1 Tax=Hibiscus sabdariffa TaxID=183260 RepID=A0ABR2CQ99_9ROSI
MEQRVAAWDEALVRRVFAPDDAETIIRDSANYSVRSDYLWLQRPEHVTEQHLKTWLVLSQLNALLPKIRIFRWCIAHEALPVVSRLQAAGHTLGLCHQAEAETILHALWDCPCTHEALDMAGLLSGISQSQLSLTLKWFDYREASFRSNNKESCFGVVSRDDSGAVLGGLAQTTPGCFEAGLAEIHALIAGLRMARDRGWTNVIFETDATFLVNKPGRSSGGLTSLNFHLQEARMTFC